MNLYDCVIVGGGPAGAAAAYFLARSGRKVLLLEKRSLPRYKCCAGGVPFKVTRLFDFDLSPCWEREITGGVFSYRSRNRVTVDCDQVLGWVTRREFFDKFLVERAAEAGAEIRTEMEFRDLEERAGEVLVRTRAEEFRGRALIGADGPRSRVAACLGLNRERITGFALEVRVPADAAEIAPRGHRLFFDFGRVRGGYCWIFPRRDHLSAGIGSRDVPPGSLEGILSRYLEEEGLGGRPRQVRGEFLSCCRYPPPLAGDRCLLAGAAGGLTDLLTGEGIYQAVTSGRLAARATEEFLEKGGSLKSYTRSVRKNLGSRLLLSSLLAGLRKSPPGRLLSPRLLRHPRLLRRSMLKTGRGSA